MLKTAKVKEVACRHDLSCFKRWPGHTSNIIIDARWVIICRLTARGFTVKLQDLDILAGATSRAGQRLVNAMAAANPEFISYFVSMLARHLLMV